MYVHVYTYVLGMICVIFLQDRSSDLEILENAARLRFRMLSDRQAQERLIIMLIMVSTIFSVIIMTMIFIAVILKKILISMIMTMRMMRARGMPRSAAMVASAAAHTACAARVKHHSRLQLQQLLCLLAGRAWASSQGDLRP